MKKHLLIFVGLLLISSGAYAQTKRPNVIDTPTAFTIGRGTYEFNFLGYDNGGVNFKTFVGLHDAMFLGASTDIQNLIGKDKPRFNIPGVVTKIKFTDGTENFPIGIAIGYDSFYIGKDGKVYDTIDKKKGFLFPPYYGYKYLRKKYSSKSKNQLDRTIYGPYAVITNTIYLFDSEQYISYGARVPTQPDFIPKDSSYFLGIDVPLGEYFRIKAETERVYWNLGRTKKWLVNFGVRYTYLEQLSIEFDLLLQTNRTLNRVLRIEYHGEF
ncbi:MAG: hypothetical protein MUD12_05395 [Spirochaetes bacterium]|jgi:hypothetical protein|nr:hypothetical protein [Spirochaetota bacterium]